MSLTHARSCLLLCALCLCALPLAACDDGDATQATTDATAADSTSSADGDTTTAASGLSACQPTSPARPAAVLEIIDALHAEISASQSDPSAAFIGVMPNHKSGFWDVPLLGFNRAKQELGFSGEFHFPPEKTQPLDEIVQAQIDTMTQWTSQPAQAIGLSCKDAARLGDPIKAAIDAGIPVITFDSDATSKDRLLYLGALNEAGGQAAGAAMVQLLNDTSGKVIVLTSLETELNFAQRVAGIQAAFSASPDQLIVQWGTTDDTVISTLDAALTEHGDALIGVITTNGTFGPIAGDWVVANQREDKVKIGAWDLSANTQRHLEGGTIQLAFAQRAYFYGYLTSYILYAFYSVGTDRTLAVLAPWIQDGRLDTGLDIISPELLPQYQAYQLECLNIQ